MKTRKREKQGISLIVLVITIIVMIILAATVVISLSNSGIISKANDAVDKTDLANAQDLATMLWADAYLELQVEGDITEKNLEDAVLDGLKAAKIDTSKYTIIVTTSGVVVKEKVFPIKWNTLDVMGNPSVAIDSQIYVKVSDALLTIDELAGTQLTITYNGETAVASPTTTIPLAETLTVTLYESGDGGQFVVLSVLKSGEYTDTDIGDVTFSEAGVYAVDYGTMDGEDAIDADLVIDYLATE